MGLRTYVPLSKTFDLPGGDTFVVRGLSLSDISQILHKFKPEAAAILQELSERAAKDEAKGIDVASILAVSLEAAPKLVYSIIATAADEPGAENMVAKLPVDLQVEAFEAVGDLTFRGEGGPKKVIEAVIKMMGGVRDLVTPALSAAIISRKIGP